MFANCTTLKFDNYMKNRVLLIIFAIIAVAQEIFAYKITGLIFDSKDEKPVVGVNVNLLQNSKILNGVITDLHGKFQIEAPTGKYVMELSYIGYEQVRMELNLDDNINLGEIKMEEKNVELSDVVVESTVIIQKADRKLLIPSKKQISASSDGVSLLQNLQIPRIVISPVDNSVKTLSDDGVQLRINGVIATVAEVMAINPKDVIRIEYHDQPGVRYNGAAAVIDYIVRHRDNGGSLILAATDCITNLGWGEYYVAGKAHFGKSSIQFLTSYSPRDVYWTRSNIETYKFTDNCIENREEGTPTRYITHPVTPQVKYNWSNADKSMLNISLRGNMTFTPYAQTDRDSHLYQHTDSFKVHDHESDKVLSPSVDVYYQHNLKNKQSIYFDITGGYSNSKSERLFSQTPIGDTKSETISVKSLVRGNKYYIIGEAIYEKEWDNIVLTAGARHHYQWVRNYYGGNVETVVRMNTAETYGFAEVRHRLDKFTYVAGIGVMQTLIDQEGVRKSTWIARPQLTLSYDFGKGWYWKYKGYVSGYQPSLSQLSNVSQQIDKYQIRRGNPALRPVMYVANEMELSWQSKYVTLNLWASYSYDHKPIMEDSFEELVNGNPMVIRTDNNQRGFHRLKVNPSVQVKLLDGNLVFTVAPFANYYVSLGNNYEHRYFNPGVRAGVYGLYKGWRFFADVTTRSNELWGETIKYGEIHHDIGVNYNTEHWSCGLMIVNPFSVKGYTRDTENLSAIAPNVCHTEMKEFHQVLMLNIRMNLDFGTKRGDAGKRIDNEDNDTGILKGSK